jgi:hypothetical protein
MHTFLRRFLTCVPLTGLSLAVSCGQGEEGFTKLEEQLALQGDSATPVLTKPKPQFNLYTGEKLTLDFNNERRGNDEGMKYSCEFDQKVDLSVGEGRPCLELPGAPVDAFDPTTGKLNWGPLTEAGTYELLVTGTNAAGKDAQAFTVNVAVNNIPSLAKIRDQHTDANRTLIVAAVNENTHAQEAVSFACFWDAQIDDKVNPSVSCNSLPGDAKTKFDDKIGVLTWTPPNEAVGNYELILMASNSAGADEQIFPVFVAPDPNTPVLTKVESEYTSYVGSTFTLDFNNERIGSDRAMSYSCRFDTTVDGKVPGSRDCDSLPDAPDVKFDPSTGRLRWGPIQTEGRFEIRVVGENVAGFAEEIFVVRTVTNRLPVLAKVLDQRINANRTFSLNVSNTNPNGNLSLYYSCTYDTSLDGAVPNGQNCDFLQGSPTTKFNNQTGAFTWTPSNAAIGSYEFVIKAINSSGQAEQVFKVIVDPDPDTPVLTKVAPVINSYLGDTLTLDFKNEKTGSDTGMNYSCTYDLIIDGQVTSGNSCNSLPDGPATKFSPAAGVFSWGTLQTIGQFEIAIRGQNIAGIDEVVFSVRVQQNQAPRLSRILDRQMEAGQSFLVVPVNATVLIGDEVSYSCRFDATIDGTVSATANPCSNLPGLPSIKFDTVTGTLNWIPDNTMVGSYEFRIRATNSYGSDEKVFVLVVTPTLVKKVKLGFIRNVQVITGETVTVDAVNTLTNSDAGVSYSCFFDALVDGEVVNSIACDSLPGTPSQKFNTVTGALTWIPNLSAQTEIELKIVGTKEGDSDQKTFIVSYATQRFGDVGNSAIVFDPNSWDFGSASINETSAAKSVTLTNNSTSPIYLGAISSSNPDFILNWSACPSGATAMASQATCIINLSFRPSTSNQLGSALTVRFGRSTATASDFSSVMGLSGRGVGSLSFDGLQTISAVTHNSLRLNWNVTPQAASFLIFQVVNGNLVYLETLVNSGGTVNSRVLNNLMPATSYTFRVRATDYVGVVDSNIRNVTATTEANRAPAVSNGPSAWAVFTGRVISPIDFQDTFTNSDNDRDGDAISYSCRYDTNADGSVASDAPLCSTLINIDATSVSFGQFTGILSNWKPAGNTFGQTYEFSVVAADLYGASSAIVFSTTIARGPPLITGVSDYIFPNGYRRVGDTLSLDFDDTRFQPPTDTDMNYSCTFRTLNTSDSDASSCSNLPGTFSLNASTGVMTWTPSTASVGAYSLTVTGTNLVGNHSRTFRISILPAIDDALRIFHADARFAFNSRGGQNSQTSTINWGDILYNPSATDFGTLTNFNTATAWVGSQSATNPMSINFDGVDDFVNFPNTLFNGNSSLHFDAWIFQDLNTKERVIFSQGDSSDKGIILTDRRFYLGQGSNTAYRDAVLADSPVIYWRFNDISGGFVSNSVGNPSQLAGLVVNPSRVSNNIDDATFDLASSGIELLSGGNTPGYLVPSPALASLAQEWTIETWFTYPFPPGSCNAGWCVLVRTPGFHGDGHVIVDATSNNDWLGTLWGVFRGISGGGYSLRSLSAGWHHLVAVGAGSTTTFYINGVMVGSSPARVPGTIGFVGGQAGTSWTPGHNFGRIDEFAVYQRALSVDRIQAHYAAGRRNQCTFTLRDGFWHHIVGTLDDSSHTGTLHLNGSQVCSFSKPPSATVAGSTTPLTLGRSAAGALSSWKGRISSLIFYGDASTTNIASNYAATSALYGPPAPPSTGMRLWLRADQGLFQNAARSMVASATNDPVLIWDDQSGTGGHMAVRAASDQTTARPLLRTNALNGRPVVSFDGIDDNLQNAISYTVPNTVFVVARYNGNSPLGRILSATSNDWFMGWQAGFRDRFFAGSWVSSTGVSADNNWLIYATDQSTNRQRLFRNNESVASATAAGTYGPNGLNLGSNQGTSEFSISEVAEVLVYDRVLSDSERQTVFRYLNSRYGIY